MPTADLLLVDGKHLFWRAAAAASLSEDGSPTGGIYAFVRSLVRVHEDFGGVVVVCWEGSTRRNLARTKIYSAYKDHGTVDPAREEIITLMVEQMGRLIRLLRLLGVAQAKALHWEADDALGTLSRWAERKGWRAAIYSGDSDMCQCVSENVFIIRPVKDDVSVIDSEQGVFDWLGVRPCHVPLLKALAGDHSDNIPGVKGIGKVGAARLANKYGSLKAIVESTRKDGKPDISRFPDAAWEALRKAVESGQVTMAWNLAQINRRANVEIEWAALDRRALVRELISLGFRSLLGTRELYRLHKLSGNEI